MGKKSNPPPKNRSTGEEVRFDVIDFAEDFFHLSKEDVMNLPGNKLKALVELEEFFGEMSLKKLEIICEDGFGESFDEMFDEAAGGIVFPKLARDYIEKMSGELWEELAPMDSKIFGHIRWEAYEEKYGPLYE